MGVKVLAPSMHKVSVSLGDKHLERLDGRQERNGVGSRSAAIRDMLDEYVEMRTECEDLRTECEDLRTECEDLRSRLDAREDRIDELEEQLARRSQVEEKVDVLAEKVEHQDELTTAPFWVRWREYYLGND